MRGIFLPADNQLTSQELGSETHTHTHTQISEEIILGFLISDNRY